CSGFGSNDCARHIGHATYHALAASAPIKTANEASGGSPTAKEGVGLASAPSLPVGLPPRLNQNSQHAPASIAPAKLVSAIIRHEYTPVSIFGINRPIGSEYFVIKKQAINPAEAHSHTRFLRALSGIGPKLGL